MITRAPLIIPPNGAIFLPAAQPSGVGTEKGGRRERSFVWLESGIAQIQFHRRERDPVRSSARSSFHKHIYRRLDALQWRFNLANAFCALWPAGLSLSFSLSIRYLSSLAFAADSLVSSLSLSFWRKPVDGANFFHREQPGLVKVDPFQVKKPIFFFFFWKWIVVPLNFFRCIFFSFFLFLLNVSNKGCLIK